ncbi:MAG: acetyltransferase [Colwellia sp.]|nr:acetyltransferase [Colwellia sp.]
MNRLVIIGAGGHGRVVADCAKAIGDYDDIVFLDDCFNERKVNEHWKVIGPVSIWSKLNDVDFIVAFGNNKLRKKTIKTLQQANANLVSMIHPSAVISQYTNIGVGTVVFANAVVNVNSTIGKGCIINTGATVDHDCNIHPYVHISPGVNIAGGITVGALSWLGIGSTVIEGITLAENTQVGAGAAVIQSTQANSLYLGVPAKRIRSLTNYQQD